MIAVIKNVLEKFNGVSKNKFNSMEELYNSSTLIHHTEDLSSENLCRVTDIYSVYFEDENGKQKVFSYCRKETATFDMFGNIVDFIPYEIYCID